MNAVERLIHYTTIPNEPTAIKKSENEPPSDWPSKGEIVFDNYQMRYREGLELVLKGLNFTIKPQEKIGIVGRTVSDFTHYTLVTSFLGSWKIFNYSRIIPYDGSSWRFNYY